MIKEMKNASITFTDNLLCRHKVSIIVTQKDIAS